MSTLKYWLAAALLTAACSSESHGPAADGGVAQPGPYDTCSVDDDCTWGEIKREINKAKDCVCLYGCPYLPLAKTTVQRRSAQYDALCDPMRDGSGAPCGIDDCAPPPRIACNNGVCGVAAAESP